MDANRRVLDVAGAVIRTGTSLFNTHTEQVLWYDGIRDGQVQLDTVGESIHMSEEVFRTQITAGHIIIESHPLGHAD